MTTNTTFSHHSGEINKKVKEIVNSFEPNRSGKWAGLIITDEAKLTTTLEKYKEEVLGRVVKLVDEVGRYDAVLGVDESGNLAVWKIEDFIERKDTHA